MTLYPQSEDPSKMNEHVTADKTTSNDVELLNVNEDSNVNEDPSQESNIDKNNSECKVLATPSMEDDPVVSDRNVCPQTERQQQHVQNHKNEVSAEEEDENEGKNSPRINKKKKMDLFSTSEESASSTTSSTGLSLMEELILAQTGRRVHNLDLVLGCPRTIQKPKRYEDTEMIEKKRHSRDHNHQALHY